MNVYRELLGTRFSDLPDEVQDFHDPRGETVWRGEADVRRGRNPMAHILCSLFGFPNAGQRVPLDLRITPSAGSERWDRNFGGRIMSSVQTAEDGVLTELLGPVRIHMRPVVTDRGFSVRPIGWSLFGLPLPKVLMPGSENEETGSDGVFHFNVHIFAPLLGPLVTYRGRLERADVQT